MKSLFSLALIAAFAFGASAQSTYFERYIQGTGGTINDTLDNGSVVTLDLSTDDVEQENDEVDSYYDDDLDAGWEGDPSDQNLLTLGLRFTGIEVPQGTTIDSAFVVFHAHEGKTAADVAMLTIVGEATDNATTFDEAGGFTDSYLLTDRPQTTAQVAWTVAEDWTIWQPYKTVDISSVIQEIVDRPNWQWNNAIALIFLPEDQGPSTVENAREFTSFENIADPDDVDPQGNPGDGTNHPERRPYLQIYHQAPASIDENRANLFNIFPNPVTGGELKIELNETSPATVNIVNVAGQAVHTYTVENQFNTVDVSSLAPGMYLVHLTQNGITATKKMVIK